MQPSAFDVGAGLAGRGVIVTGACGGIGRAVALAFAAAGARVMATDTDPGEVDAVVAAMGDGGHSGMALDLRDLAAQRELVARTRAAFGDLHALVHIAAVLRRRPTLADISEEDWDVQIDVNLKATFFLCRAAAEAMKAQGRGGRVIAFVSQAWWTGSFGAGAPYAASKGGVVSLLRGFARSYGRDGITVNTIAPGLVDTPMLMDGLDPALLRAMTESTPLGRVAAPEEMAGTVLFLASRHAGYITGATINASGGFLMY